VVGSLLSTGLRPTFLYKFERKGVPLPNMLFQETRIAVAPVGAVK
jgi:hypothetical protein